MESMFSFISGIPTYYYYIGGFLLLVLFFQRYDENHRYNQKSGPIENKSESPKTNTALKVSNQTQEEEISTGTEVELNQQMIDFLKTYDPSQRTWTTWAFKKFFPESILEDLSDAARTGSIESGMKIIIHKDDWEIKE